MNYSATFVLCFCFFLDLEAKIILNMLFNTLLTITPHNMQNRRRRKERTTYGPLQQYWLFVTYPVLNLDRQCHYQTEFRWGYCEIRISSYSVQLDYKTNRKKLFRSSQRLSGSRQISHKCTNCLVVFQSVNRRLESSGKSD